MPILLPELLNVSLHDIFTTPYLPLGYSHSAELLKPIIYLSRQHLIHRTPTEIETACNDLLYLYQWYFNLEAEMIRKEIAEQTHSSSLLPYLDVQHYIDDRVQDLKLTYLNMGDVLNSFRYQHNKPILNQIQGVQSDFSNVEFLSVLALYHASLALSVMRETPQTGFSIEKIHGAIVEAQHSIDYAKQLATADAPEFSNVIQEHINRSRSQIAQKAHRARYGDKYQKRRAKAIEGYKNGNYRNRFEAALYLIDAIQAYSVELNIPPLKSDSAQETIYRWLSHYDKTKS